MKTRSSQVAKWMMRAWMFSCNLYHDFQFEPLGNRTAHCCLCDYSANVLSTTIVAFVNTVSIYALISSLATLTVTVSLSMSTKTIKKQETRRGFPPRLTLSPATYRKIPYGNCGNMTPPFSRTSAAAFLFRNRLPIFFYKINFCDSRISDIRRFRSERYRTKGNGRSGFSSRIRKRRH